MTRFLDIYDTRLLRHTRVYAGWMTWSGLRGTLGRVAVLTNKPLAPSERILQGLGIRNLFDVVVGGDGPMPRKPDPSSLNALMREAGAAAGTSMLVGDSAIAQSRDGVKPQCVRIRCCVVSFGLGLSLFPEGAAARERQRGRDNWRVAGRAGGVCARRT